MLPINIKHFLYDLKRKKRSSAFKDPHPWMNVQVLPLINFFLFIFRIIKQVSILQDEESEKESEQ